MKELEKAISKREVIGVKSEVAEQRRKVPGADAALRKDISTLQKNLKDADKQMAATESNIGALGQRKAELAQQLMQVRLRLVPASHLIADMRALVAIVLEPRAQYRK